MSKADDMFEELGYKKDRHSLVVMGKKKPYITYINKKTGKKVAFNRNEQVISIYIDKDYEKIIQAVNEKVKELGWLE